MRGRGYGQVLTPLVVGAVVSALSVTDARAWVLDGIMGSAEDAGEAVERSACGEIACKAGQALENPKKHKVCAGKKNEVLRKKAFCDEKEQHYVNPLVVAKNGSAGTPECRYYLQAVAKRQAVAALAKTDLTKEQRDVLTFGGQLLSLESCEYERVGISRASLDKTREVVLYSGADESKTYCGAVYGDCAMLGGKLVDLPVVSYTNKKTADVAADGYKSARVSGEAKGCVVDGVLLDKTCLRQPAAQLRKLRASLKSVSGYGTSCLKKLSPVAGEELSDHLSARPPKTQICCGNDGCSADSPYPSVKQSKGMKEGKDINAFSYPPAALYGTIQLPSAPLAKMTSKALSATLFHEYLHRMGMCENPMHNKVEGTNYAVAHKCGEPFGKCADKKICDKDLSYEDNPKMTVASFREKYCSTDYFCPMVDAKSKDAGLCVAFAQNTCPKGNFDAFYAYPAYDPVYACEWACYPSIEVSSEYDKKIKDLCRGAGGQTPFVSSNDPRVGGKSVCDI